MNWKHILIVLLALFVLALPTSAFADGGHGGEEEQAEIIGEGWWMPLLLGAGAAVISAGGASRSTRLTPLQIGIIGLGAATGLIHLTVGLGGDTLLLLNGLGYLGLLGVLFLPIDRLGKWKQPLRWGLLVYTLVTLVGYFIMHTPTQYTTVGLANKAVEVLLIVAIGWRIQRLQTGVVADI